MPLWRLWCALQRWSPRGRPWPRGRPRGQILKSLALASRPQVLENWPVLGSRTALFFGKLKFCGAVEKFFGKRLFVEIAWKIFVKTFFFFFWRALALCVLGPWPWPRAFLSLASRVSVLGKAVLGLGLGLGFFLCPWPWPWPRALCPRLHLWCFVFIVTSPILVSHALASVVAYLIAHTNFGSAQNGVFAVSRTRERIRFGCDVNWSSSRYTYANQKLSPDTYI